MKRIIILAVVLFVAVNFNAEAKRHHHGVGGYFYTELAPYGSWIEVDYGVVVWRPTIIRTNWMPYNVGRWVWTYDGCYWDSYEPFGHITYHYGRDGTTMIIMDGSGILTMNGLRRGLNGDMITITSAGLHCIHMLCSQSLLEFTLPVYITLLTITGTM